MSQEKLEEFLERTDKKININFDSKVFDCINSSREERESWTAETCLSWAYELSKYQIFIQNAINKEISKIEWYSYHRNYLHGKYAYDYGDQFCKIEQRLKMLSANNESCRRCDKEILDHETEIRELKGLSYNIGQLVDTLKQLAKVKARHESNRQN